MSGICWATCAMVLCAARAPSGQPLPAFPGAEGFGAYAVGGRGGAVFVVDTLEDYHPGQGAQKAITRNETGAVIRPAQPAVDAQPPIPTSLRACLNTSGPRTIVFAVSGTIELKAPLVVQEPYLTLAGQSAPGGGICLKNFGLSIGATHDIVVRYLRVRPGDRARCAGDAINIGPARNIIINTKAFSIGGARTRIFAQGNLLVDGDTRIEGGWELITKAAPINRAAGPFPCGTTGAQDPESAMLAVLGHGGASLPKRDAVDTRVAQEFRESKGKIINSPSEVGGWPLLDGGETALDSDRDGMPDAWEIHHDLNPRDGSDHASDRNSDGYTALEEYLNGCNR